MRFKLADKRGALVDLANLLGFMKDRHELAGKDGAPIEFTMNFDNANGDSDPN